MDRVRLESTKPADEAGGRRPRTARIVLAAVGATLFGCGAPAGARFVEEEIPTNASFRDAFFVDPDHGFLIGGGYGIEGGLVGRTTDGGRKWSFLSGLIESSRPSGALDLRAGWFFDPWTGLVVGDGCILRTTDAGEHWRAVHRGPARVGHLSDITFVDDTHGWAVGFLRSNGTSAVLESSDGGETWAPHLTVDGEELHAVTFTDPDHGWAVGDRVRREPQKLLVYR